MTQAGPLARTLEDIEILWKVIAGPHDSDRHTAPIAWRTSTKTSLADYRSPGWTDGLTIR